MMTKEDAIIQMRQGKKITHTYFLSDEWITIKNGKILFEDGVMSNFEEFWNLRNQDFWNDGYELYNE